MTDDKQETATTSNAEPTDSETPMAVVETRAQAPRTKKAGRGARSAKAAKTPKAAKPARARKLAKSEEAIAPVSEQAAEPLAKSAKTRRKPAKPATRGKAAEAAKVVSFAKANKRAKPEKGAKAPATAKPAKVAKSARKTTKATPPTAPAKPATIAAKGNSKGARYSTNELSSAARKAGLTIEFTPVVTRPASIGRGPAKEFKVDAIVAHLRGSNGDLIRDRGPGTPLHNDAESIAAVEIFAKFRSRTFHKKLKVEIF